MKRTIVTVGQAHESGVGALTRTCGTVATAVLLGGPVNGKQHLTELRQEWLDNTKDKIKTPEDEASKQRADAALWVPMFAFYGQLMLAVIDQIDGGSYPWEVAHDLDLAFPVGISRIVGKAVGNPQPMQLTPFGHTVADIVAQTLKPTWAYAMDAVGEERPAVDDDDDDDDEEMLHSLAEQVAKSIIEMMKGGASDDDVTEAVQAQLDANAEAEALAEAEDLLGKE